MKVQSSKEVQLLKSVSRCITQSFKVHIRLNWKASKAADDMSKSGNEDSILSSQPFGVQVENGYEIFSQQKKDK